MIKVGLIGYGRWGKILYNKLEKFCDVKFTCRSKDTYLDKLDDVDWVVVSTPNDAHYEIVKNCLWAGKNVFCEKPLTPTYEQSEKLFRLAKMRNVKLYVDDVQNYRKVNYKIKKQNFIERRKNDGFNHSYYKTRDLLYRLTYHDIYYIYEDIKNEKINGIDLIDNEKKLHFIVKFDNKEIEFLYDSIYEGERTHNINGVSLIGEDDVLQDMMRKVLNDEVDFNYNKKISLFTNKVIDEINNRLYKKIAVVGGGIFGCTSACVLAKEGYDVDLFEKNDDIITQASYVNQYRLHRGYHYPRSKETAKSSMEGESSFLKEYGDAVTNGDINHHYCIANKDSLVTSDEYKDFLDDLKLDYKEKDLDLIRKNVVDLVVEVDELLFDPNKLKNICWERLKKYNVNVNLNTNIDKDELNNYDYIINSTYANTNKLLSSNHRRDYQFELCEKPVIKLPEQYRNKSIVIMDGPFMCIDPLGNTDYHIMGNVVHAIHSTNVGKFPEYDLKFDELLNKGIVKNPSITNIDKFINSAKKFFIDIDKAEHIGSMYTFRTVLPDRDGDDARPTLVEKIDDKIFSMFSGKIGTCVDASKEVLRQLKDKNND